MVSYFIVLRLFLYLFDFFGTNKEHLKEEKQILFLIFKTQPWENPRLTDSSCIYTLRREEIRLKITITNKQKHQPYTIIATHQTKNNKQQHQLHQHHQHIQKNQPSKYQQ